MNITNNYGHVWKSRIGDYRIISFHVSPSCNNNKIKVLRRRDNTLFIVGVKTSKNKLDSLRNKTSVYLFCIMSKPSSKIFLTNSFKVVPQIPGAR